MTARIRMVKLMAVACLTAPAALLLPAFAHAQAPHPDLPGHSHYSSTEQGWTCNEGFRQVAGFCVQDSVEVPSQGPFEFFDGQWRCRSGYKRAGAFCVTPTAPPHASLVEPGGRWECDWGFRKMASRCEEISPPAHAYLDASGHDWVCYPGYQRRSDQCLAAAATGAPDRPEGEPTNTDEPKSRGDSQRSDPH